MFSDLQELYPEAFVETLKEDCMNKFETKKTKKYSKPVLRKLEIRIEDTIIMGCKLSDGSTPTSCTGACPTVGS